MKNIELGEDSYGGPSYDDLIASMEVNVIYEESFGSYQGDTLYLVKEGRRYGYLHNGWGSCSGCDALQSAFDYGDWKEGAAARQRVHELRDQLYANITWFDSKAAAREYLTKHDWEGDYIGESGRKFALAALQALDS